MNLKKCPFCGGKATHGHNYDDHKGYHVQCGSCGCKTMRYPYSATGSRQARDAWNTRADESIRREIDSCEMLNGTIFDDLYSSYRSELEGIGLMASGITVDRAAVLKADKEAARRMVYGFIRALAIVKDS